MKHDPPPGTLVIAKARSGNEKLGDAATTYVEQRSCPTSCVFFDGGGCYAEDGPLGKFVTQPLNRAAMQYPHTPTPEELAIAEAKAIDDMQIEHTFPLRLHTVGDCKTDEAARIVAAACARYAERGGGPCWGYTHAWRGVARSSWEGVHVLASCETPEDVLLAHERGYATAIVVEEFPTDRRYRDRSLDVIPCPAETRGRSCSECRLCMDTPRLLRERITIGFAIHGTRFLRRKARLALTDPDNPNRKLTLRELIPEYAAEFRAREGREPSNREIAEALGYTASSVWQMRKSLRTGLPTVKKPHRREARKRG